ncbi:MBL fold metallo-hydrolase [Methyloversatilis thermotolerans]|uniref:MBL fold metallo-hydrolase n=1 Tax=Methyloversatilis thermotolerans TaxID=1346290 RepID=UPI00039E420D|nr:MBL fold metallo-hydrolase [Methyloversatilis thermotolerans]
MAAPRRPLFRRMVAACALLLAQCATAGDAPGVSVTLKPVQVGPHSWYVQGDSGPASLANEAFNSNAGFVVTGDGVVVIDALGSPALGQALVAAIRGVTDQPIRRVLITHYHADHFYGLQAFKAVGAEVWAHRAGREYIEGEEGRARLEQRRRDLDPWVDANTRLVPADLWLEGDTSFRLGALTFELVYMGPAHAPDDMVVIVREDRVVYSGDILFIGRIPFVGDADSRRWLATMDQLLALRPGTLVTGHGPASTDPARDLAMTRDYIGYLRSEMGKAVAEFVPFDEAYARTDWSRWQKVPAFDAANRINAYGTYLRMEQEVLGR